MNKSGIYLSIFCLLIISLLYSCSTAKKVSVGTIADYSNAPEKLLRVLHNNEFACSNLKCKFVAEYVDYMDNSNTIKGIRGSLSYKDTGDMLLHFTFLGANVMSMRISSDSVLLIDKRSKTYIHEPLDFISVMYGCRITTEIIEDVLFGRIMYEYYNGVQSFENEGNNYNLCLDDFMKYNVSVTNGTPAPYITDFNILHRSKELKVSYPEVTTFDKTTIPSQINITVDSTFLCIARLSQFEINVDDIQEFNLKVPSNFERVRW